MSRLLKVISKRPSISDLDWSAFESLEPRTLLSVARIVDAGEEYRDYNRGMDVALLRATDQVIVGFGLTSAARRERLANALVADDAPLAGYKVSQSVAGTTAYLFERTARGLSPELSAIQKLARHFPAIKYIGPTYFHSVDHERLIATDQVEIDLAPGVDPAVFFAKGYTDYQPGGIGSNAFIATLKNGGGTEAVRVSSRLTGNAQVYHALPDTFAVPAYATSFPGYGKTLIITGIGDWGPVQGTDAYTSDDTLILHGFADSLATIAIKLDGQEIGTTYADDNGKWSFDYSATPIAAGNHLFSAASDWPNFDYGEKTAPFVVHIGAADDQPPWIDRISTGTEFVFTGDSTRMGEWTLTGRGEPGAFLIVRSTSGLRTGVIAIDAEGNWRSPFSVSSIRSTRHEDLLVERVDQTGNPLRAGSRIFSETFRITYDPIPPAPPEPLVIQDELGTGVDSVWYPFNTTHDEANGGALADFVLTRDGIAVPWTSNQSFDDFDLSNWAIRGLSALTSETGDYVLRRTLNNAGITDGVGNKMTDDFPIVSFLVAVGTNLADRIELAVPTSGPGVAVIINGATAYTSEAEWLLLSGLGGDDFLIDELPLSRRPVAGVSYVGNDGIDELRLGGTEGVDFVNSDDGALQRFIAGTNEWNAYEVERATLTGITSKDRITRTNTGPLQP